MLTKTNLSMPPRCQNSVADPYARGCMTPAKAIKAIMVQLGIKYNIPTKNKSGFFKNYFNPSLDPNSPIFKVNTFLQSVR
jgi:hypothetical protein